MYYIEATPKTKLAQLLTSYTVVEQGAGFAVEIDKQRVPSLLKQLVTAELDVYALQPTQKTLEDQFLEMTGGGAIDEIR